MQLANLISVDRPLSPKFDASGFRFDPAYVCALEDSLSLRLGNCGSDRHDHLAHGALGADAVIEKSHRDAQFVEFFDQLNHVGSVAA